MSSADSVRSSRLEARIAPEALAVVRRAAELEGRSVSDFVVSAAQEAARRVIDDAQIVRLSMADQERVAQALAHQASPRAGLLRALDAHRELIRDEV